MATTTFHIVHRHQFPQIYHVRLNFDGLYLRMRHEMCATLPMVLGGDPMSNTTPLDLVLCGTTSTQA
jgi:hypothetical protein